METKAKLTPEEIERNFKRLEEAKGIARLGNQAELSEDVSNWLNMMARGEMSHEEIIKLIIEKYSNN